MTKRLIILFAVAGTAMLTAFGVGAQFVAPHQAGGSVNTAVAATELLYICRPSGYVINPICPIDTAGADEDIFVSGEDLLPGSVRWEKIRLRNVSSEPWDVQSLTRQWQEVSDPSGLCTALPEPITYQAGVREDEVFLATGTFTSGTATVLNDTSKDFLAIGVLPGDSVRVTGGAESGQSRTITSVSPTSLTVSPGFVVSPYGTPYTVVRHPFAGPGVTILGWPSQNPPPAGFVEPAEGVRYQGEGYHGYVASSATAVFRYLNNYNPDPQPITIHVSPGDYVDLLLGIRLPISTPSDCLNVVWQLTTTWDVRVHFPP
jgi:hypothetical protein